jgi:Pyruvate/2-oxoacid:ferredoxin oxidoreductase delta subunit
MLKLKGVKLNSGFTLTMPGNSIIINDYTNPEDEIKKRLETSKDALEEISRSIKNKITDHIESDRSLKWFLNGRMTSIAKMIYKVPKHFWTNSKCSKCGICMKLCPEKNILVDDDVKWGNNCLNCLACFHWCPNKAVELDKYSKDRKRYHHPEIDVKEMYI